MLSAMKKTLILTAFLSVLTFAAAQDTSGTSTDATSTDSTSMDMSGTSTDATSTDTSSTDATSTDATSTDTTTTDTSSTDATSTDATSTDATGTDTSSTDATSTDATSTDGTSMDMSGTSTDGTSSTDTTTTDTTTTTTDTATDTSGNSMAMMSPADAYAQAQALASQADVAYPTPFYDRTLWKQSVDSAFTAHMGDMQNRDYAAYLAQLYTKTQWWINAYNAWKQLGDLTDQEKDWASLSAAKLAYISLQNGNKDQARQYVNDGMAWKDSPSLQSIMKRL